MRRAWVVLLLSPVVFLASLSLSQACCVDRDGDGYGVQWLGECPVPNQLDCNDSNPAVNPGATEKCNGIDDDCDGLVDEGFNVGQPCTVGVGLCETQGTLVCTADGLGATCNAVPGTPETEVCNGIDDDCDGSVDEGFDVGLPCIVGIGICETEGALVCTADGLDSECDAVPGIPEIEDCNETGTCSDGIDNDCDGKTDMQQNTCLSWCMPVQSSTVDTSAPSDSKLVNFLAILLAPIGALVLWRRIRRR